MWITGMDISTLSEVERCGGRFYDKGVRADAMDILKKYGMNMVRLRLWNDPFDENGNSYGAGGGDLDTVLSLAARAKDRGVSWLLDFHYSDFWADPGKQRVPKAWRGMDAGQLAQAVHDYTASVLARCRRADLMPQMVAVGNELSNGLLWPYGKTPEYRNIAAFVSAGIRAVREAEETGLSAAKEQGIQIQQDSRKTQNQTIPVMIHLDNGGNNELYRRWFDRYFQNGGEDFECIGLSYYPFWHGTPEMLQANLNDLAARYGKELIIAEVSMGFTMEDYASYEKLSPAERKGMAAKPELAAKVPFPMTPQGQADFMEALIRIVQQTPGGLGKGFFYWEPAWLPVPGSGWANQAACAYIEEAGPYGNEWANQALFDYDGNALPALEIIRKYAQS